MTVGTDQTTAAAPPIHGGKHRALKPKTETTPRKPKPDRAPTMKRLTHEETAAKREPAAQSPSVGRIVHMYDHDCPAEAHNGVEHGPFAAIVTMVRPATPGVKATKNTPEIYAIDETIDVMVFPPAMNGYIRGGVAFHSKPIEHEKVQSHMRRYWTWPPRS